MPELRICIVTLAACASASTQAATFGVRFVDSFAPGTPIVFSQDVYQSPFAGNLGGPSPNVIDLIPSVAFDSYVAVDIGPSTGGDPLVRNDGFYANPGDLLFVGPSLLSDPRRLEGQWVRSPGGLTPTLWAPPNAIFDGQNAAFLGRFSFHTTDGSQPSGDVSLTLGGIYIDIVDPDTVGAGSRHTDALLVNFTAFDTSVKFGLDGADLMMYPMAYEYQLKLHTFEAQVGDTRFLVNDMYVVAVPAPGITALLLAGAPMVLTRRRRS